MIAHLYLRGNRTRTLCIYLEVQSSPLLARQSIKLSPVCFLERPRDDVHVQSWRERQNLSLGKFNAKKNQATWPGFFLVHCCQSVLKLDSIYVVVVIAIERSILIPSEDPVDFARLPRGSHRSGGHLELELPTSGAVNIVLGG